MDVALELEDDMYFADLSKQISLLIMDEEEEPVTHYPPVPVQAYSRVVYPPVQSLYFYEQACRKESKGTGVFIPRSSQPTKRRNKQGRFSSKSNKQTDNTRGLSQISYKNHAYPKRFQE